MQTRFYDSAEPGPPHGWLDADQGVPSKERPEWENAVTVVQKAARRLADSLRGGDVYSQIWGSLRTGGCWWIYRVIPAGEDRFGRPGRTLTALFCSDNREGFDWENICTVAPEMESLVKNRNHLSELLRLLDSSPSSASITDDLLKHPCTPLLEALKLEMGRLLDGLGEGHHEYFAISGDGTVSNRVREDTTSKPPSPPPTPNPSSGTVRLPVPIKKPQQHKSALMKTFISHALCLGIGLLLGFGLHGSSSKLPADNSSENQPVFHTYKDAITDLRAATNYLEQRWQDKSGSFSPEEPQPLPQHRSPTPQSPRN